jgi:hypothetical protein
MLDLTERQRALQLPRLLAEIVGASLADVVLLDILHPLVRCLHLSRMWWKDHFLERRCGYATIITVARKIPEDVFQEDPKLLMW